MINRLARSLPRSVYYVFSCLSGFVVFLFSFFIPLSPKYYPQVIASFPLVQAFPFFLPSSPSSQLYFILMWLILFSSPILGLSSNKLLALCYFPLSFCVDSRHNCSPLKKKIAVVHIYWMIRLELFTYLI